MKIDFMKSLLLCATRAFFSVVELKVKDLRHSMIIGQEEPAMKSRSKR